jgi:hypothetical protein
VKAAGDALRDAVVAEWHAREKFTKGNAGIDGAGVTSSTGMRGAIR